METGVSVVTQQVLLLNASYEPLRLIAIRRAVILLLQNKAEVVEAQERQLNAAARAFVAPLVIRLARYVYVPQPTSRACSRRGVLVRDQDTCQYCGAQPGRQALTLDHVVPRVHGGRTVWENVVAACASCNHRKGGRTPEQAGMKLLRAPHQPRYHGFSLRADLEHHEIWRKYAVG